MVIFMDSFDPYQNNTDSKMTGKYISTSIDQQVRRTGRWSSGTDNDFCIGLMNTGFGRSTYDVDIQSGVGNIYTSWDIMFSNEIGGAFAAESDFFQWTGLKVSPPDIHAQAKLAIRLTGKIQLWRSSGGNFTGTMVAESTEAIEFGQWYRISVRYGKLVGVQVKIDDTVVIDEPDFALAWDTDTIIRTGLCWEHFGNNAMRADNYVVNDSSGDWANGHLPNMHVVANYIDVVSGATLDAGTWVPSTAGPLHPMLYESQNFPVNLQAYHDFDATYIHTEEAEDECLFKFRRFIPYGEIYAVAPSIVAKCADGVLLQARVFGNSDSYSSARSFANAGYRIEEFVFPANPENGLQWLQAGFVNQLWKFGARVVNPVSQIRITQIAVEIAHVHAGAFARYRVY